MHCRDTPSGQVTIRQPFEFATDSPRERDGFEPSVPGKRDIDFRAQWKNVLSICVIPTTVIAEPSRSAINGATFMRVAFSG